MSLDARGLLSFATPQKERVLELGSEEEFFEKEYFSKCDPQACKL